MQKVILLDIGGVMDVDWEKSTTLIKEVVSKFDASIRLISLMNNPKEVFLEKSQWHDAPLNETVNKFDVEEWIDAYGAEHCVAVDDQLGRDEFGQVNPEYVKNYSVILVDKNVGLSENDISVIKERWS